MVTFENKKLVRRWRCRCSEIASAGQCLYARILYSKIQYQYL